MVQIKNIITYENHTGNIVRSSTLEIPETFPENKSLEDMFILEDNQSFILTDEVLDKKFTKVQLPLTDPVVFLEEQQPIGDNLQDLRTERKILLDESDWTQLPDSPLSAEKKAEWAVYRQALRDFPINADTSLQYKDIEFPTPPA